MVSLRTRLCVGDLLLRSINETGKCFNIYSHQYSWVQGNDGCGCHRQFGLIRHADWLFTPCADWRLQAFPSSRETTNNDTFRTAGREVRFQTGPRSRTKTRQERAAYVFQELLGDDAGPGVNRQFHFTDFLVDLLHEMDDKVHQFVFVHLLCVEVGNQEANIVSLQQKQTNKKNKNALVRLLSTRTPDQRHRCSYLHWFSPQDEEVLRSHHHEAHELVTKDLLNLISLKVNI